MPPFAVLSNDTVRPLADHARRQGRLSIAHTTSLAAVRTAVDAGVDVLPHVPRPARRHRARRRIAAAGIVVIPTLVMMRGGSERINARRYDVHAHAVLLGDQPGGLVVPSAAGGAAVERTRAG